MISIEKYKKIIYIFLSAVIGAIIAYALIKYVVSIFLPFIVAIVTVCLLRKVVGKINKKTKIPSPVVVFLLSVIILALITLALIMLFVGIQSLVELLIDEISKDNNIFTMLIEKINIIEERFPFLKRLDEGQGGVVSLLADFVGDLAKKCSMEITLFLTKLPNIILTTLVTVISLFYFAKDYDNISAYLSKHLPKKAYHVVAILKNNMLNILSKYAKSYLLLFFITFAQLISGFLILNIKSPIVPALIISVLDVLPVLGSSLILIVWAIGMLLYGNLKMGIGLLALAIIIYIVRQIAEPRLLSAQMNVHPLVTLFFMYAGFRLSGVLGMLFAPLIPFVLKPIITLVKKSKNTVDNKNKLC